MEDIKNWESKFELCQYSNKLLNILTMLNKRENRIVDINEVKKSIYYAQKYHGSQLRKSGEPYYSHPLEVAYLFAEYVGEEKRQYYTTDLIVTVVLHDTIEDTKLTKEMIATIFNKSVASNVEDLTRIKVDRKISAGETVNTLFLKHKKDVLHIKLFDRLHNMRTIEYISPEKRNKIIEETFDYFLLLAESLELNKVRTELIIICYQYLSVKLNFILQQEQLGFSFDDNCQILSRAFQNEVPRMRSL